MGSEMCIRDRNVAVPMRKLDNPECKVISLIVDAYTERCVCTARLDVCVEIIHFSRLCGRARKLQFRRVNCVDVKSTLLILNKSSMYRKELLNWMAFVMSCFVVLTITSYSKV